MAEATAPGFRTIGPVDAGRVERYADAARDRNPVHLDADFARRLGLDGPIVHGMFVMGQFEPVIRQWAADRDIENVSVRFTKPVPVGSTLTLQARIAQSTALDDSRVRTLLRLVAFVDRVIVCIGTATLVGDRLDPA